MLLTSDFPLLICLFLQGVSAKNLEKQGPLHKHL